MTAKSLHALLAEKAGKDLAKLADKAQQMVDLASIVAESLPPELAGEVRGANVRDDETLVVVAASSAAAARLRFEEDALLKVAVESGFCVSQVSVRVARQA